MTKLAVNALIRLWARSKVLRDANLRSRGGRPGLPVPADLLRQPGKVPLQPRLRHGALQQLLHEYVELARIHRALREVPPRYLVAVKTDCLVYQSLPRKFLKDVEALARRRHRGCTPRYRFEEVKSLQSIYSEPRLEAEPPAKQEPWRHVEDPRQHCLDGKSPAALRHAGHRQDVPGEADRHAALGAGRGGDAHLQGWGWERRRRTAGSDAPSVRAAAPVVEEVTQPDVGLWADIAELSTNRDVKSG